MRLNKIGNMIMIEILEKTWKAETVEGTIAGTSYKDVMNAAKQLATQETEELSATISYLDSNNEWVVIERIDLDVKGDIQSAEHIRMTA